MDVENEGDNQDSRSPTDEMQKNQPTVSQQQALSEQSTSVRMLNTNKEPISYEQQILESLMGRISESSNDMMKMKEQSEKWKNMLLGCKTTSIINDRNQE